MPLGETIRQARELKGWSLAKTAERAHVSPAYLKKLEDGDVHSPSPHRLAAIARALTVPYADLMRLAGYLVPGDAPGRKGSPLAQALLSNLTPEETRELAEYLAWYRRRKPSSKR